MKSATYKIEPSDMERLQAHLLELEAEVDSLADEELDAAEARLEGRIQQLLQLDYKPLQLVTAPSRSSWNLKKITGASSFAFLAAALSLFFLHTPAEQDAALLTKGAGEVLLLPCETKWTQDDRSTPEASEAGLKLAPQHATHVAIECPRSAYVHAAVRENGQWRWLQFNQKLESERTWLQSGSELLDLTPYIGREVVLIASLQPLPAQTLEFDAEGPILANAVRPAWFDRFELLHD